MTEQSDFGKVAYDGYICKSGGVSLISGATLPEWDKLTPAIQDAWRAAARAVVDEIREFVRELPDPERD